MFACFVTVGEQLSNLTSELNQSLDDDIALDDSYAVGDLLSKQFLDRPENIDLLEELYQLVKAESNDEGPSGNL